MSGSFSPNFETAFASLMEFEGGLNVSPSDRGGITNFGVSLRFLRRFWDNDPDGYVAVLGTDGPPTEEQVRTLDKRRAKSVFQYAFWIPLKCDYMSMDIAREVSDFAYNAGTVLAAKTLQRSLNNIPRAACLRRLTTDGIIGERTLARIETVLLLGDDQLLAEFQKRREHFYRRIVERDPTQSIWLRGWLRRAKAEDTPDLPSEQ